MKVLVIGATGNLGLRLIPSLMTHSHTVVAFVRSSSKLQSQLPPSIFGRINVVQGSALDAAAIKAAILDNNCDAVVNTAGLAAVAPWGKTDLPEIFSAVVKGIVEATEERQKPIRAWFLGGMGVLNFPGTSSMLSNQ
jgi:nucleoside-diphosphate-sugar epimerase